jgi:hypothetical protein
MSGLVQRPGLILFCLAILIGSVAALWADVTPEMVTAASVVAIIAIVLGEQLPLRIAGRVIAPLTTAPALGLILSPLSFGGEAPSAWTVLAVVWLSILAGGLVARARGLSVVEGSLGSRFLGMVVTTLLARGIVSDGQTLVEWAFDERTHSALGALGLLVAAVVGGLVERGLDNVVVWVTERGGWRHVVAAEVGPLAGISAATVATGPLIALASPVLDWAATPLLTLPVLLSYLSVQRVVTTRQALEEAVVALSRFSEITGLTRVGHVQRVADLSVAIGREMGADVVTLRAIERTALLHDVGQLGLREQLRGGATIHASTAEEATMARSVARVIAGTPQLAELTPYLDQVRTPFRRTREFGEHIPLPSRIVRVANAWDDITEGAVSARAQAVALERLHLGLGYDYDPEVVTALERAVASR